jgi:hypothetical protein
MALKPHWILHIGAHKTGTTQLQDILELQRDNLLSQGLDYLPRREFRGAKLKRIVMSQRFDRFSFNRWCNKSFDDHTRHIRNNAATVLVSEENIIGTAGDLLCNTLYPQIERNISAWVKLFENNTVDVLFSIRSYASLLVSAYTQMIREGKSISSIHQYYENFLLISRPNWSNVVDRILLAWPNVNLRVWSLEKYSQHKFEILERVTGCKILRNEIGIPSGTRTPSAQTVQKALRIDQSLTKKDRKLEIAKLYAEDDFKDKYAPFNENEIEFLTALYRMDLAKISLDHPGIMLDHDL